MTDSWQNLGFDKFMNVEPPIQPKAIVQDSSVSPSTVFAGGWKGNFVIVDGYMQSKGFVSGSTGWRIDSDGIAEFASITLTGGTIKYGKTSFTDSTNAGYWMGALGIYYGAANDATYLKYTLSSGAFAFVGTISGRSTATIASAIDSAGAFINANLDTSAKTILGDFTFGVSGAIKMITDANNGLWLSPTGILGKKAGANTFTIGIDGTATFAGTLSAASGTFGTITAGTLNGLTIDGTSTLGGRLGSTIASAISALGNFIDANLDTSAKNILAVFTFGASGALQIGTYVNGVSGDLRISPSGIVGRNSAGANTFTIDGTTGTATFAGTLSAAAGTLGSVTAGTFTGVTIAIGSSNSIFKADTNGIYLGNATFASAPFRVTMAGALTATSVTVSGALTTAAGSSINGTYIDSLNVNQLVTGTISSKQITLAVATGDTYIASGKTDFTNTQNGFILGMDDSDSDLAKFYIGDATNYLNWNGTSLVVSGTSQFIAGDILFSSSDTAIYLTDPASYAILRSTQTSKGGAFRIKFSLQHPPAVADTNYGRIYKGAVAVGTERTVVYDGSADYVEFSEDISGWSPGDNINIYVKKAPTGNGNRVYIQNFRIYVNDFESATVIL